MNCNEVIPRLSPFHDGELGPDEHRAVAEHIASCAACSQKLESIRRLSDLVETTPTPEAPGTLVARIERSLHERAPSWAWFQFSRPQWSAAAALVASAAVVVVGLTIWFAAGPSHRHTEMVRDFGKFLDAFEQRQASAVELLPQKYHGTLVSEAAATSALKRETVARPIILANYQATHRYVLKMPCCDCVETVYACAGKTPLVLFEHDKEQSEWFDARSMTRSECRGKACCVVQLKDGLAATWPVNGGFVTVVGVRDVEELGTLVGELNRM
jgi:Putative zinc-finger